MNWTHVLILSLLAEAIVQTLKPLWDATKRVDMKDKLIVLGVSIVITLGTGLDVFGLAGLPLIPWAKLDPLVSQLLGSFLTGILVSRGSNWIHDIVNKIIALIKPQTPPTP